MVGDSVRHDVEGALGAGMGAALLHRSDVALDEADALERGFSLREIAPPHADNDDMLRARMVQSLGTRA